MLMRRTLLVGLLGVFLAGCQEPLPEKTTLTHAQIVSLIPKRVKEREAWAEDMAKVFDTLKIEKTPINICTSIAIIDQESNFAADPVVPKLGETSLAALEEKLEEKLGKNMAGVFKKMLATKPTPENNFIKQIKAVKTERELDELYRKMFAHFGESYKVGVVNDAAKFLGKGIDEKLNPITTLGSMQVHIDYAKDHRRANMSDDDLRDDLYSRYGGLYYGIHRLMLYQADYDKPLYRFADYNSGMYSSRNAAFQRQVATLSGKKLSLDGDLLIYKDGSPRAEKGQTETALIAVADKLGLTAAQIRQDLKKEKSAKFESTATYQAVKQAYAATGKEPSYAIMPEVVISGVKLSRDYNTNWFATNVDRRYQTCISIAKKQGLPIE